MTEPLLRLENLKKHFPLRNSWFGKPSAVVKAVDGVSLEILPGETVGLVGESGCGKSTLGRALIHLDPPTSGRVSVAGKEIAHLKDHATRLHLRQNVQMVFQDPYSSLNPRHTVRTILEEPLIIHGRGTKDARLATVLSLLDAVGLPRNALEKFPHEFSGGQRQRISIARAIALRPKLVVADEPVSALDVSIQAQILNLLLDLQEQQGISYLFISHDLHVVRWLCQKVAVMYLGKIVEQAPTEFLFRNPRHPYTRALLAAIPEAGGTERTAATAHAAPKKTIIRGELPSPLNPPSGCAFHPRCPLAVEKCKKEAPPLKEKKLGHAIACWIEETPELAQEIVKEKRDETLKI